MDPTSCIIDGVGPMPVVRPASVNELCERIRQAGAAGEAVYPLGGRTHLGLGLAPERPGVAIDTTGLAQVIDYPARDMTITVQAGIRVADLQRLLAAEGQRLPVDVPDSQDATLGGIIATNTSGSRRLGAGTLRDYVIGITTVNDEGRETKAGGRVVKNVAGYDLNKLHTGALGTLGIISQVTLKVRPTPEAQALVSFGCDGAALGRLLDELHESRTRPTCIDAVNGAAGRWLCDRAGLPLPAGEWAVIVGFEDAEDVVGWQIQQLIRELTGAGVRGVEATAGAATGPMWDALTALTAWREARLAVKAAVLPGRVAAVLTRAGELVGGGLIQAHAGSGVVRVQVAEEWPLPRAKSAVEQLEAAAVDAGGNLVLPRCPTAWKRELPVWGRPRGDLGLMRRVKEALDPRRMFNPGRFVGGM